MCRCCRRFGLFITKPLCPTHCHGACARVNILSLVIFGAPTIAAIVIAGIEYNLVKQSEIRTQEEAFDARSRDVVLAARHSWLRARVYPELAADFVLSHNLTLNDDGGRVFARWAQNTFWDPHLVTFLQWVPHIKESERAFVEAGIYRNSEQNNAFMWGFGDNGEHVKREPADFYWPIYFSVPNIPPIIGWDLRNDSIQTRNIQRARTTGNADASTPFELHSVNDEFLMAWTAFIPLFTNTTTGERVTHVTPDLWGCICPVFQAHDVFKNIFHSLELTGLDVFIYDTSADLPAPMYLTHYSGDQDGHLTYADAKKAPMHDISGDRVTPDDDDYAIDVYNRRFRVILVARPGYFQHRLTWLPLTVLLIGLGSRAIGIVFQMMQIRDFLVSRLAQRKAAKSSGAVSPTKELSMSDINSPPGTPLSPVSNASRARLIDRRVDSLGDLSLDGLDTSAEDIARDMSNKVAGLEVRVATLTTQAKEDSKVIEKLRAEVHNGRETIALLRTKLLELEEAAAARRNELHPEMDAADRQIMRELMDAEHRAP